MEITKEKALEKLRMRCAKAEICISDARRLMMRWGVADGDHGWVVSELLSSHFIDEMRYADCYVRDKMRFSGWGARKIKDTLYAKRVDKMAIELAMKQLSDDDQREKLATLIEKKRKILKEDDPFKIKDKLIRFALSRGFSYDQIEDLV